MISVIVNLDTRPGWKDAHSSVQGGQPCGVRSADFFTDGIANIRRFFTGHKIELIVYVDEHEPVQVLAGADPALDPKVPYNEDRLVIEADRVIVRTHSKRNSYWQDSLYLDALSYANGEYVCHIDQDVAMFRDPTVDVVGQLLQELENGYKFVCYPTGSTAWYATTRFFITKREHLPIEELRWCVSHPAEAFKKYPVEGQTYFACLEQTLGGIAGKGKVLYPPRSKNYIIFAWINYHRGLLAELNKLPYAEAARRLGRGMGDSGEVVLTHKLCLHVGCGPIIIPSDDNMCWTNIDIAASHKPDVVLDCLKLSQHFGENYADYIWSCHHLEHMAYPEGVLQCLTEFKRVLKPGGLVRIATPNLAIVAKAYVEGSDLTFIYGKQHKGYFYQDTPAERFLYFMRAWQHTFIPDPPQMLSLLTEAGFTDIQFKNFGESAIPNWHHDRFQTESLYVEARKP